MKFMRSLLLFLFFSLFIYLVLADSDIENQLSSVMDNTDQRLDNLEEVLNNPEHIAHERKEYLVNAWTGEGGIIDSHPILAKINNFMLTISPVLFILFAEEYSLSWIFLFNFIFWSWFAGQFYDFAHKCANIKFYYSILIGILVSTLLAHLGLYHFIILSVGSVFFRKDTWVYRAIVIIVLIFILVLVKSFSNLSAKINSAIKNTIKERALGETKSQLKIFLDAFKTSSLED